MFGFTAFAPALNPFSNLLIKSLFIPPTNPTLFDFVDIAATAPTRNDPS